MFDIGWQEMFLIAVLALIIIGPKDLPRALKTVTGVLRKVKGMARDFQSGLDDIVRETELHDMRKQIEQETTGDLRREIEDSLDPDGAIAKDLDEMKSFEGDLTKAAQDVGDDINKAATVEENSIAPPAVEVSEEPAPAKKD